MTAPDGLLQASGIDRASFTGEIRAAFALWSAAADIRFDEVADSEVADIVVGAHSAGSGVAFTNVVHKTEPLSPIGGIERATICLGGFERWEVSVDGDPRTYNLRYVATHEIGHAIGLDHAGRDRGIMGFAYLERLASAGAVQLAATDIAAAARLYGPAPTLLAAGSPQTPTPE